MIEAIALIIVGVIAGFLNIMAGGGSMVSVPTLIFLGIPGPVANGTNRLAILAESITSISTFFRRGIADLKLSLSLAACTIPGAILGAYIATGLRGDRFNQILAVIMVGVLILMWWGDRKKSTVASDQSQAMTRKQFVWGHVLMVGAGFWGGFIQIGVGFILMPILHKVMGMDLIRTNMHKVFVVLVYTIVALAVFASQIEINWMVGLYLAIGSAVGGWFGTHFQISKGVGAIKIILNIVLIAFVIKLLFFS